MPLLVNSTDTHSLPMILSPRTLLTTYHHAYLKKAGGEFEIFAVSEKLKQHGLIADIYGPFSRALEHYDIVMHFSVHGGGLDLLQYVKDRGKRIALWPNLWLSKATPEIAPLVKAHTDLADVVIFKSQAEQAMFAGFFELPEAKVRQVVTPADAIYRKPAPKDLFRSLYDLDRYVIGVGIIEPNKNQLSVIRALKGSGTKLVLVGGYRDEAYYRTCQTEGGDDVLFIDALPARSEILRSALSEADAFIECSFEPPGLSAIEAGLTGVRVVVSESAWTLEHFANLVDYCDPSDVGAIRQAIMNAMQRPADAHPALSDHLARHCTEQSVQALVGILQETAQ